MRCRAPHRALGVFFQRACLLNAAVCAAMTLLWSQLDSIFLLLGQGPQTAALAGAYGARLIPHLWLLALQIPAQKARFQPPPLAFSAWHHPLRPAAHARAHQRPSRSVRPRDRGIRGGCAAAMRSRCSRRRA